ncbi:MAG: CehA/McbA family metallohydrolase [Candidatus Hydrogenedentes bacterium]|nr:CehA/McbA family metallohydrolase [Candidatus Hydrogenedentota bacterium]
MNSIVSNPYSNDEIPWVKGNLHSHTTNSDGKRSPQEVVDTYAARGYGFLTISDHDYLTDPATLRDHGMTLIPGNEVTARGPHVLHIGASQLLDPDPDRQTVLSQIVDSGGLAIIAHPNWEDDFSHCPQTALESWRGYVGIEIYNGVVRRLTGSPLATDRWDRLLGLGRRVWGFAHDDSHRDGDDEQAWIMVQTEYRDGAAIMSAMREGRFYASTGVEIEGIRVCGNTIAVRTRNAERIVVHSDFGRRQAAVDDTCISFTVPETGAITYVRFECWGPGDAMAWTQPFFLNS